MDIPNRLDGSGGTAARLANEVVELLEHSVAPLRTIQDRETAELEARNARMNEINGKTAGGARAARAGLKDLEEQHKREVRRQRTDELKAGLAALAGVYRDRLASGRPGGAEAIEAVRLIQELAVNLAYNPNEILQLQALFFALSRIPTTLAAFARVG
jgi:DNA polymerase-3 subunit delta'